MNEKIFSLLIQDNTPTPDKPQEIKSLLVNEEAMKYIEQQSQEIERLHSIINKAINKTNDIEFRITGKDFNYYLKLKDIEQGKELLEILDKVLDKE